MGPVSPAREGCGGFSDLSKGAVLQCVEAGTLGMPFEVWKTRMGRYRNENTVQAFKHIYQRGGVSAYWQGLSAKLVESATKGAIFLYSKETLFEGMRCLNFSETTSGFVAGAGGGICQTAVMGPCTYIVTALVTGTNMKSEAVTDKIRQVWRTRGIRLVIESSSQQTQRGETQSMDTDCKASSKDMGLYSGSSAIAFRQATNWASRQGFTEFARAKMKQGDETRKLTKRQEICAGIIAFVCIVRENGPSALFKGIVPRIGLGIWQTLFMVTGAKLLRDSFGW